MAFFTSQNVKSWEFQSKFESTELVDCPKLFQLPVDGDDKNKKWIMYGDSGNYIIGEFNGKEFTHETDIIRYRYSNFFYASQTFNNMPNSDKRRIQRAWGMIETPEMPFNQILLFPVNLTLRTTENGLHIFSYPVKEIENICMKEHK